MARASVVQDPALAELIRVKNYKQALKNIDKKLKKQANDLKLLALRADLLQRTGELRESHRLLVDLLARATPDIDIDTILSLNSLAHDLSAKGHSVPNAQLESLWQNAVKGRKSNAEKLDIADQWLFEAVSRRQWSSFTKAAVLLAKLTPESDPTHSKYYFWQVLGHWLSKPDASVKDERLRALGQMMATRMLDKAIEQTSTALPDASPVPPHSISTRQDFELLAAVFSDIGRNAQVLGAIEDKQLGERSAPAVDEWGTRLVKIDHLLDQGESKTAWDLCKTIFDSAETLDLQWKSDDWAYWDRLLKASAGSGSLQAVRDLAVRTRERIPNSRAPSLAILEAIACEANATAEPPAESQRATLLQEAKAYFDRFSGQSGCSAEVGPALRNMSPNERQEFKTHLLTHMEDKSAQKIMSETEQLKWITGETNVLRLELDWLLEAGLGRGMAEQLESFICTSLNLYRISRSHTASLPQTDVDPGDDACLLAVRAMVKLSEVSKERVYLVQGALLLSKLLEDSKHTGSARIMLINILTSLGLPSLAMTHYQALRVRQILVESCAPLMFHRLATLMPFRSGTKDPYKLATEHLSFYSDALTRIPDYQMVALDAENYVQVREMDLFRSRLQHSSSRRLLRQERTRMSRFRLISCNEDGLGFDDFPSSEAFDASGIRAAENCHLSTMGDQMLVRDLPVFSEAHLNVQEKVQFVLGAVYASSSPDADVLQRLKTLQEMGVDSTAPADLPAWERNACSRASDMASLLVALFDSAAKDQAAFEASLLDACARLEKGLGEPFAAESAPTTLCDSWAIPCGTYYHQQLTELEIVMAQYKLAVKMSTHCKSAVKLSSKASAKVSDCTTKTRQAATARHSTLKESSTELKTKVSKFEADDSVVSRLLAPQCGRGLNVGQSVESVVGTPSVKRLLHDFTQAANEALSGIEQVILP